MSKVEQKIGFIGAGQMARALAGGLVKAGLVAEDRILASDPVKEALDALHAELPQAKLVPSNAAVAEQADVLILAVKPQQMAQVLNELRSSDVSGKLLISIAAGVRLATIRDALAGQGRLVRVMPNTPCLVGQSASGYSLGPGATPADGQLVASLLNAVGRAFALDEKLLDAVTGLSGSGPAFVYVMIEALSDGGVQMGLPRDVALALAAQTLRGAAEMVLTSGEHPAVLKDRVTSPGGTTIAGLQALEAGQLRGTLMAAVEAATRRSIELGNV